MDLNTKTKCNHLWVITNNKEVCTLCGKDRLLLKRINDDVFEGTRSDGSKYSVRTSRTSYFLPELWLSFYNSLNDSSKLLFEFLINTGARIEEALLFMSNDIVDLERNTIKLYVTKKKARKQGEEKGKPRTFEISKSLINKLKSYDGYIFIKAPKTLDRTDINKKELRHYTNSMKVSAHLVLKKHLKDLNVVDYYNYSLHNIRKTHGMWLKALGIPMEEICLRLGHNYDTYLKHYGSPSVFNDRDKKLMIKILGGIYNLRI